MKKVVVSITLILALLFSILAVTLPSNLSRADPYLYEGPAPPRSSTLPPNVSISSPKNNSTYDTNSTIALTFRTSAPTGPYVAQPIVSEIYYMADWRQNRTIVYEYTTDPYSGYPTNGTYTAYSGNLNLTDIPEGTHNITVVAIYAGYYIEGIIAYSFSINGSSTVTFAIPPKISILSLENENYTVSKVPLDFTVDANVSKLSYVLDGMLNQTLIGNTTLTGLANGAHNITIYAWDVSGNVGTSETVHFTIAVKPEPFSTSAVAAVSAVAVIVVVAGLLVHFKKRKCGA